jgi:CRP-like cAMP-binding protein
MKTMIPLRCVAIASNVAFIAFALPGRIYPVLVLHTVLLPLNVLRLQQMRALIRKVREASRGKMTMDWLIPLMHRERHASGDVLFRIGEPARSMYLILDGTVLLVEIGVALGAGDIVGEMGVFAPDSRRTGTAVCASDVEVGAISDKKILQLYYQNPKFGFSMFQLVIQRMQENMNAARP